jgi:uncharacterized protein
MEALFHFQTLLPALLGGVVGITLSLTGAGGGVIAVPLLIHFLNLTIQQAAPIGLVAVGFSASVGAVIGFREGSLRYRAAAVIGGFGILFAPVGVLVANELPSEPLMYLFAIILAFLAYKTLKKQGASTNGISQKLCRIHPELGRFSWTKPCAGALAFTGIVSGFLSGLLGVGGGFVIVPALSQFSNIKQLSAISTSLGVIALVATSGITAAGLQGAVDWFVAFPFACGALVGMLAGKSLSARFDGQHLSQGFALVCLFAAASLVGRAGGFDIFQP